MVVYFLLILVALTLAFLARAAIFAAIAVSVAFVVHLISPVFLYVREHPVQSVLYVAGYFLLGAVWSVVKWWFVETNRVRGYRERFKNQNRDNTTWEEYIRLSKTNPINYKSDIIAWIAFWPFSGMFTLLNDPIRRLCRRIYFELQEVYQRITDYVWK